MPNLCSCRRNPRTLVCTKVRNWKMECRDDNIVQATSELQHSWIWYEATFCDKKYPGPGSRNSAPERMRRLGHVSPEHNYNYRKSSFSQGRDLLTKFSLPVCELTSSGRVTITRAIVSPCPKSVARLVISPPYKAPPPSKYLVMSLPPSLPCPWPMRTHVKNHEVSRQEMMSYIVFLIIGRCYLILRSLS